jgi:hypothetical protein
MALSVDIPAAVCKALSARAHAGQQWPDMGFHDQFAHLLAQLLNISLKQRWPLPEERKFVERCQWFDDCCRHFLQRHPQAVCIELGAGLSTRFHRLSVTSDWPRFQWVDVDLPPLTDSKARVLPHIDNYTLIGADMLLDDWLRVSGWVHGQPLLVVMEGTATEIGTLATLHLINKLCQQAGSAIELEIVLDDWHPHGWQVFIKSLAVLFNGYLSLPITRCIPALERIGCKIPHKKDLLGGKALGLVINYQTRNSHDIGRHSQTKSSSSFTRSADS